MPDNPDIYSSYKPLRNHLMKCEAYMSLAVIRAYAQNLQFKSPFPVDIEVDRAYLEADDIQKTRWISEWNLVILAKEVIINSPVSVMKAEDFRRWSVFSRAINKVKDIEGTIARNYFNKDNILGEMHRVSHNQFPWQIETPNKNLVTRYYKIFNTPELNTIIRRKIGLGVENIYLIGHLFLGSYLSNFAIIYPIKVDVPGLDAPSIDKFLIRFSLDIDSLRNKLLEEQKLDDKFFYTFSSLRSFPIVKIQRQGATHIVCPIPTLLFWRFTSGLYYEICREDGFDNAFGKSYQRYIGDCMEAAHTDQNIQTLPEKSFTDRDNRKATVDWILDSKKHALFIECKAKRMTLPSKIELGNNESLENDLDIMANSVTQVYKTIRDYMDDKYPHYRFDREKRIYPLIVTLEDWHLWGDDSRLTEKIRMKMASMDIPTEWLASMPYTICSTQEFESLIQIIQSKGIEGTVAKKLSDDAKRQWAMATFLSSEYPQEHRQIRPIFADEFEGMFSKFRNANQLED